ncbi:hypothetical protein [Virgibacillus salexigens]|uniref:hypothetical protein n=1 Tax=Virgibacillus TaxID=84406 RepID=UPI001369E2CA|nr:hypothetical protein [Virgibacillus massiliensis]MYL41805.1 hypothetical protein [Virgibacillus massiliensis]
MIKIVEGSLVDAKQEMKNVLSIVKKRLSNYKKTVKPSKRSEKDKQMIEKWEAFIHFFRVSQMAPVYIENICINYILYTRFMKKLKDFQVKHSLEDNKLIITYRKGATTGKLELYDISDKLDGMNFFPRGELSDE